MQIIDIELASFFKRIEEAGLKLDITDAARSFVADAGFDVQYGARPLKRAIQSHIEDPLSELLLRNDAQPGDTIVIDVKDDGLVTRVAEKTEEALPD